MCAKKIPITPTVARDLRSKLLLKQMMVGLSLRRGKTPCYLKNGKARPGLGVRLTERLFGSKRTQYSKHLHSNSSLFRGRLLDRIRAHYVDCNKKKCDAHTKMLVSEDNAKVINKYYNDVRRLGMLPVTTQLIVENENSSLLTAVDEVLISPDGFVICELKSGYRTDIDKPCTKYRNKMRVGKTMIPDTFRNRHAIQAALSAYMFTNDYGKVREIYVCYLDREISYTPDAHKLKVLTTLEWYPVHEAPWYNEETIKALMNKLHG